MNESAGKIAIYQSEDGQAQIDVRIEHETLWLTLLQLAELFDRDKSVISRHLKNIFETGELPREATVAKTATVQSEGGRKVSREIEYFNLDAVISVGYRVNSIKGTQFRIWANRVLKDHLVQGYTLNQQRLEAQQEKMDELRQAIALSAGLIHNKNLSTDESRGILTILEKYSHALTVLDDYDHRSYWGRRRNGFGAIGASIDSQRNAGV